MTQTTCDPRRAQQECGAEPYVTPDNPTVVRPAHPFGSFPEQELLDDLSLHLRAKAQVGLPPSVFGAVVFVGDSPPRVDREMLSARLPYRRDTSARMLDLPVP